MTLYSSIWGRTNTIYVMSYLKKTKLYIDLYSQ